MQHLTSLHQQKVLHGLVPACQKCLKLVTFGMKPFVSQAEIETLERSPEHMYNTQDPLRA